MVSHLYMSFHYLKKKKAASDSCCYLRNYYFKSIKKPRKIKLDFRKLAVLTEINTEKLELGFYLYFLKGIYLDTLFI